MLLNYKIEIIKNYRVVRINDCWLVLHEMQTDILEIPFSTIVSRIIFKLSDMTVVNSVNKR